jgi:DtxR family transcriptional regulator, Mn-dependent transcriptional regulator
LAGRLEVTPSSVSAMLRQLQHAGYIEHTPYRGVRLTDDGRKLALAVLRRHRLLELFLTSALGLTWDRVHEEAELLEHALSTELEQVIAQHLGQPALDPHGDPIPSADGTVTECRAIALKDLPLAVTAEFVRVSDSDSAKLRYLAERKISLGDRMTVIKREPFDGPLIVRVQSVASSRIESIGVGLAAVMRVKELI